jgi:cell division protein ZapA (FtsZ GTPase activity inhibitor)
MVETPLIGEKKSARISILGFELRVKTDTDSAYVEEIARLVEERVKSATTDGKPVSTGVALLAAMNIADDLHKLEREQSTRDDVVTRRIESLLQRVERALDA